MNECFTGRLEDVTQESAKLIADEIGSVDFVVIDVVFHDSQNDHTKGAFILKTTVETIAVLNRLEIGIGARLLELFDMVHHK